MLNNANTKDYILYGTIYMKGPERQIYRDRKEIHAYLGLQVGAGINSVDVKDLIGGDENVLKLDIVMVVKLGKFIKIH